MAKLKVETLADRRRAAMERIRGQRNARLAASDWTEAADAPLSAAARTSWRRYRALLRDWPARVTDPLNPPPWPDDPAAVRVPDAYLTLAPGAYIAAGSVYDDPAIATEWPARVQAAATRRLQENARAAFLAITTERQQAAFAESAGLPLPEGVRPTSTLDQLMVDGQAAYKAALDAVAAAASVAEINAALEQARDNGLTWLVGPDWEPYPEECPWTVAT